MAAGQGLNGDSGATRKFGLSRVERLSGEKEFDRIFSQGRRISGQEVILWSYRRKDDVPPVRLGVIVSRKLGGAVHRNRLKRLIRESFRLNKARFHRGVDVIVYPRPGCAWTSFRQAEEALVRIWKKAGILSHENAAS